MRLCALVLLTALLASAPGAAARDVVAAPLGDAVVHRGEPFGERAPGDLCEDGTTSYYWTVDGWFTGEETYAVLCEPAECQSCSGGWKPLSVTIYLYWPFENECSLSVTAEILAVDASNPECLVPGAIICSSAATEVGPMSPAGLWAVTVSLNDECLAMNEPFFASLTFHDACEELPVLVTDAGPCEDCSSWNDWGIGWRGLCDFGFPGNLSMFATLECQGPSPVQTMTWTTIKNMYRGDD